MNSRTPDEFIEAVLARADDLEEQGSRLEALELLQTIESSRDPVVLARIGVLLFELERWREAEAALLDALKLDPELYTKV